jgi:hypothetical protein
MSAAPMSIAALTADEQTASQLEVGFAVMFLFQLKLA